MSALLENSIKTISKFMHLLSGIAISAMALITCFDVITRRIGFPFDFPFEVVCALAGIVIGFALPEAALTKAHVTVEYLETKLSAGSFRVFFTITRLLGIGLFAILFMTICRMGIHLHEVKQTSAVLQIPEFFFPFFLATGCLVTCLVLLRETLQKREEDKQ
jgi:TRAP-type C4-dicarboxylate transport system permease small subunit